MNTKNYPLIQRLLHWLIGFCILFMLFTVFLRLNWMNKHEMAELMSHKLSESNVQLNEDQSVSAAKAIRNAMWKWHVYIGYVLIGLFAIRMVVFATHKKTLSHPENSRINTFKVWVYRVFYFLLGGILLTGFLIVKGPDSIHKTMEDIHAWALYIMLIFIILHFGGILLSELGNKKGIVSDMINGGNKQ